MVESVEPVPVEYWRERNGEWTLLGTRLIEPHHHGVLSLGWPEDLMAGVEDGDVIGYRVPSFAAKEDLDDFSRKEINANSTRVPR